MALAAAPLAIPADLSNSSLNASLQALQHVATELGEWEWRQALWSQVRNTPEGYRPAGYQPTPEQMQIHRGTLPTGTEANQKLVSGGEGSGKSYWAAMEAVSRGVITPTRVAQIGWVVGPQFKQTRPEMEYMRDAFRDLGWLKDVSFPNNDASEWQMWLHTGLWIYTLSAQDPSKLANRRPDWILLVEAAQCPRITYTRCRGRIGAKDGWLAMTGTLEHTKPESEWYADLLEAWRVQPNSTGAVAQVIPAWSNPSYYPGGAADPKIRALRRDLTADEFAERVAGERIKPKGLVFHEFESRPGGNVVDVATTKDPPADPEQPWVPPDTLLEVWIDPAGGVWSGASAYAVLAAAVQRCPGCDQRRVVILDELYLHHLDARRVIQAASCRPWWPQVSRAILDFAGKAEHGVGESHTTAWRTPDGPTGPRLPVVAERVPLREGNNRVQRLLAVDPECGQRHLLIHGPRCPKLIWELGTAYRNPMDSAGNVILGNPVDKDNHAAAALRYGVYFHFPPANRAARPDPPSVWRPPWRR